MLQKRVLSPGNNKRVNALFCQSSGAIHYIPILRLSNNQSNNLHVHRYYVVSFELLYAVHSRNVNVKKLLSEH